MFDNLNTQVVEASEADLNSAFGEETTDDKTKKKTRKKIKTKIKNLSKNLQIKTKKLHRHLRKNLY